MKILVVEDEAPIRDLISINLQLVGYEVFSAEDGIIAQEFLEKQKVDVESVLDWIVNEGGGCDCEVIYNVEERFEEYGE